MKVDKLKPSITPNNGKLPLDIGERDRLIDLAFNHFKKKRYIEAFYTYLALAEKGDVSTQTFLGWMYYSGTGTNKNLAEALRWFKLAAKSGSVEACYYCGRVLTDEQKPEEAITWFRTAAIKEYHPALYRLGLIYRDGLGITKNDKIALQHLRSARNAGSIFAESAIIHLELKESKSILRQIWLRFHLVTLAIPVFFIVLIYPRCERLKT